MLTAKQAQLKFFEKEVAEISQAITEAVLAAAPTAKTVTVPSNQAINICNHVANLYRENGFTVMTYDNRDGTVSIGVHW